MHVHKNFLIKLVTFGHELAGDTALKLGYVEFSYMIINVTGFMEIVPNRTLEVTR